METTLIPDPPTLTFVSAIVAGALIGAKQWRKGEGPSQFPTGIQTFTERLSPGTTAQKERIRAIAERAGYQPVPHGPRNFRENICRRERALCRTIFGYEPFVCKPCDTENG